MSMQNVDREQLADREQLIEWLAKAKSEVQSLPDVSLLELEDAQRRLRHKSYLVAVFGAFSAGKSSLLNALLGDPLLVVSPNPTTASVTRLATAREDAQIRDVVVTAKTEDELWRDVLGAFEALHEQPASLSEAILRARTLNPKGFATNLRSHVRFLVSVADGYAEMGDKLGQTWSTTADELKRFSAQEKQAAYISRVDVYRKQAWLDAGFIFVDTPGVDSIHRRHTDVAFRYMRHADAVLFVMYYTHAFTQRDRDFLLQLSGVQDVTSTNKLFTVINAVDLAKSDEERTAVRKRVEDELRRLGIRTPRVYEASSQLALAGRQLAADPNHPVFQEMARSRMGLALADEMPSTKALLEASGLPKLEQDLKSYVESEGSSISRDITKRTLVHLQSEIHQSVVELERLQAADANERQMHRENLAVIETDIEKNLTSVTSRESNQFTAFEQSLQELVFHAGERIRLRYRDLFRHAFHPGRFRIGKMQEKLQEAAEELTDSLARQVDIELRTFSLRATTLVQDSFSQALKYWFERLEQVGVHPKVEMDVDTEDLVMEEVRSTVGSSVLRPYFRFFSSPRQFFEGTGSKEMMDATESDVLTAVRKQLDMNAARVIEEAQQLLQRGLIDALTRVQVQVTQAQNDVFAPVDLEKLNQLRQTEAFLLGLPPLADKS